MNPREIEEMSWRMAEVYEAVVNRIMINLARHFQYINAGDIPSGAFIYQARKLAEMGQVTKETEQIILNMLGDADGVLRALLEESILNGLKDAEPALRKAAIAGLLNGGTVPPVLDPGQMQAFQAFYKQSADKLNLVNTVMLESTQWAYQSTVADIVTRLNTTQGILNKATGEVVTGVSSWNDAIRKGVQGMVQNGITGFVDHGGHRWSPEAYVAMDVRSTMANTARAAIWERCDDYGDDLYQVSWHNAARPLCFDWQCKVISRSDTPQDVEDDMGNTVHVYAQSETTYGQPAGLFGINCGHYPIPFIPGFSRIRQAQQDKAENDKAYKESQQQRYLERKLREEKRDLEVMKAQGASDEELKWQRQRIRDASNDIDEFCAKTGRTRRRDRETAPVRATWPADAGEVTRFDQGYIQTTKTPPTKGPPGPKAPPTPSALPTPPAVPPAVQQVVQPVAQVVQNVAQQATQAAPEKYTIGTAKDMDQLAQAVKDEIGVTMSDGVKDLNFEMVRDAFKGIKAMADDFPSVGEMLTSAEVRNSGVMSCSGQSIRFNDTYFKETGKLQESITRCSGNGWWPKNTSISSIGVHETAHSVEWFLDQNNPAYSAWESIEAWNKRTEAKAIVSQACKNVKKTDFGKGKVNKDLITGISRYASDSASEAMAEAFADVYSNGDSASPLAKEIVKLTKEKYKEYGGK